jgi:hypothetical protein
MLMLVLVSLAAAWAAVLAVVVAACVTAGRADRELRGQTFPLRSTCRTVRNRILTSSHRDQLATYR